MYVSLRYFFNELFSGYRFRIEFEKCATFYLVDTVSLIGIFLQWLFYQLSKFRWRWNVFKNFPEVLFDRAWKSLVIWICRNSFSKRRRLHIHHEQCGTTCENIWFFTVVFWKHSKLSQLSINERIVDIIFVRLFIFYFFFSFV